MAQKSAISLMFEFRFIELWIQDTNLYWSLCYINTWNYLEHEVMLCNDDKGFALSSNLIFLPLNWSALKRIDNLKNVSKIILRKFLNDLVSKLYFNMRCAIIKIIKIAALLKCNNFRGTVVQIKNTSSAEWYRNDK
jgi:hypothetical protein